MRFVCVTERAADTVGPGVIVEAETAEIAAEMAQELFERELEREFVCEHCEQPYPLDVLVFACGSSWRFKPQRSLVGERERG